jgi:uncharacterized heparinase superfamily protein
MPELGWGRLRSALGGRARALRATYGRFSGGPGSGAARSRVARRGVLPGDLAQAAARPPGKVAPRYPESRRAAADVLRAARDLLQADVPIGDGRRVPLEALRWSRDPFGGKGSVHRLRFHALHGVEMLVQAHALTGELAYIERARVLAERWIADALAARSREVWDDHATALRAITLARLWHAWRTLDDETPGFAASMLSAAVAHAAVLADEREYRPSHNHGVVQAYALLALGLVFPGLPGADRWVALGRARLIGQLADNVSVDGLHREHSPAYHFFVLRHFLDARALAGAHGLELPAEFAERLAAMARAGLHLLKPDGTPAALGDTCRGSGLAVAPEDLAELPGDVAERFLHVRTAGARGRPPGLASTLAEDAGYAFLRGGADGGHPADEAYVVVRTGTFRTAHVHRDVLSFELYAFGDDLVVDPGGPYAYGSPVRGELMATAAHNTVTVDDGNQAIGRAEVLSWSAGPGLDVLDARHRLYPGVVHRRLLAFVRRGYLVVVDRLEGATTRRFSQAFHLAPALDVVALSGDGVATTRAGRGPTLELRHLGPGTAGVLVERGRGGAQRGWVCVGAGQLAAAPAVRFEQEGRTATFVTLLVPRPDGAGEVATAVLRGRPFVDEARVSVTVRGIGDELLIPAEGPVTIRTGLPVGDPPGPPGGERP